MTFQDDGGLVAGEEEDPAEVIDAAAAAADDSSTTTTTTTERAQLEFTHHVYEEYMPTLPRESKPPIIIQTVPHYQVGATIKERVCKITSSFKFVA